VTRVRVFFRLKIRVHSDCDRSPHTHESEGTPTPRKRPRPNRTTKAPTPRTPNPRPPTRPTTTEPPTTEPHEPTPTDPTTTEPDPPTRAPRGHETQTGRPACPDPDTAQEPWPCDCTAFHWLSRRCRHGLWPGDLVAGVGEASRSQLLLCGVALGAVGWRVMAGMVWRIPHPTRSAWVCVRRSRKAPPLIDGGLEAEARTKRTAAPRRVL